MSAAAVALEELSGHFANVRAAFARSAGDVVHAGTVNWR
jgi:hypothetical protein